MYVLPTTRFLTPSINTSLNDCHALLQKVYCDGQVTPTGYGEYLTRYTLYSLVRFTENTNELTIMQGVGTLCWDGADPDDS